MTFSDISSTFPRGPHLSNVNAVEARELKTTILLYKVSIEIEYIKFCEISNLQKSDDFLVIF